MLTTFRNALRVEEIRKKLLFTALMLLVIRIGSNIPIPGVNTTYFSDFFASQTGDAFNFFNAMTGGSFSSMSILALSITPYITSSIIMQLMTIAIPRLEELQREGEDGRRKITEYTRYVTVALALIESIAMTIGFGRQGLLTVFSAKSVIVAVCTMSAGSAFLMWIGEKITDRGIGNGISMVLLFNILSSLPQDLGTLGERFLTGKSVAVKVVMIAIIAACILAMIVYVIVLQDAERRIPVQYSGKVGASRYGLSGKRATYIPLKVNTAGVIPVIFASSLMTFPVVIAQFFNVDYSTIGGKILLALTSSNWFRTEAWGYSVGFLIYVVLIIVFAYFYTSITFNPLEVANNMKKSGGFIPGIRPGKPTSDYLNTMLNFIVFIGAVGLLIVAVVPIVVSGLFSVSNLSFTGTSLIIIVGVVLETLKQIESMMVVRNYSGFLSSK